MQGRSEVGLLENRNEPEGNEMDAKTNGVGRIGNLTALGACVALLIACAGESTQSGMSKDEARKLAKADSSVDYCAANNWYGDGTCDDFCMFSDPDCSGGVQPPQDALVIDASQDGQTLQVAEGAEVIVRLPANPSTGYQWEVTGTDRSFGYPAASHYVPYLDGPIGSGGTMEFVWKTQGFLPLAGSHALLLEYRRPWEENASPADTFSVTVVVVEQDAPDPDLPARAILIEQNDNGKTFDAEVGQDVIVRLSANPSTGYQWQVVAVDRTIGYPAATYFTPDSDRPGTGGTVEFVWKTDGFLSVVGSHTMVLEYRRPWETDGEPADSFSFTVVVSEP
jgi:inhibitor of cysteine peptidase